MRIASSILLLCTLAACAPAAAAGADGAERPAAVRRDPNRVTLAEIRKEPPSSAMLLIESIRRHWLRDPLSGDPGRMADDVVVYLDGTRMGGREELRHIQSTAIGRMEFMEGRLAIRRYGTDHALGAILIFTPTQADYQQP